MFKHVVHAQIQLVEENMLLALMHSFVKINVGLRSCHFASCHVECAGVPEKNEQSN